MTSEDAQLRKWYAPPTSFDWGGGGDNGKGRIDVGVDVGSSKVCVVVGERTPMAGFNIMAVAEVPTRGYSRGHVSDRGALTECVAAAIERAEEESEVLIRQVMLAVTGESMVGSNHQVEVDVTGFRGKVSKSDSKALVEKIHELEFPHDHVLLHQVLQRYSIDGATVRGNPIGQRGTRLGASFHVVHGLQDQLKDVIRCVTKAGVEVLDVIFSPLASAKAVGDEDAESLGCLVMDVGAELTGYVVHNNGVISQSGVVRFQSGGANSANLMAHFTAVQSKLGASAVGLHALLMTGGGSLNPTVVEIAEEIFHVPVRAVHAHPPVGRPAVFQNPSASAALGAMMYARG